MASTSIEAENPAVLVQQGSGPEQQAVERRAASLYSPALYFETKMKILDLMRILSEHGYLSFEEAASAMNRSSELVLTGDVATLRQRVCDLEEAVRAERLATEFAMWDRQETEDALTSERELVRESLARIASLEGQLKDARRTTLKLIAASRNGLATLKRVRDRLAPETYAAGALAPLVQDFRELTQVVQELHALAIVKASTAPLQALPH